MRKTFRVLIAKPGLDGHDRGAKVVAYALRDAGFEVVYTGLHQTVEQVATAALQEAVDVVALSILSGAHLSLTRKLSERLEALKIRKDVAFVVGGTIPPADVSRLRDLGVDGVFPTGTPLKQVVRWFRDLREGRG
ncbi:MAG: cobalamin B12-binding domain-containing protein [Desulfobacteria bacterium]